MTFQQCEVCGKSVGRRFCDFHAVEKITELEKKVGDLEKDLKSMFDIVLTYMNNGIEIDKELLKSIRLTRKSFTKMEER